MDSEWTLATLLQAIAIGLSLFAVGISTFSLEISRRAFRRSVQAEDPLVFAEVRAIADQPGWYEVKVTLQSRSTYGWQADLIEFTLGTKALTWSDAHEKIPIVGEGYKLKRPLPSEQARRRLPVKFAVTAAGNPIRMSGLIKMGDGEHHHETLFVYSRPSIWLRTLSMRVNLHSKESIERHKVIPVRRTLPHAPTTATA
jgi:hypothetical protein